MAKHETVAKREARERNAMAASGAIEGVTQGVQRMHVTPAVNKFALPQPSDSGPLRRVVCRFMGAHLDETKSNSVSEKAQVLTGRLLVLDGDISFTTFMKENMPEPTGTSNPKPDAQFWETVQKGLQQCECSVFDVEKDTSLTQCVQFEDDVGAQRSLKATLGDFVVLADTTYPSKFSLVPNQREVLRHKLIAVIEVQSGAKNLQQALTQLYLTLAVQHHALRFVSPLLVGVVVGEKEHGDGSWFLQPMMWRTDQECGAVFDGTFEATPKNMITCVEALVRYKSERHDL